MNFGFVQKMSAIYNFFIKVTLVLMENENSVFWLTK